jgi:dTDP-4-dehydrorhamnose reductase
MKIVITGATGVLGSYINYFFKKKYTLFCFGFKKKTHYNINLFNKKKLILILKKINPDIVINCAAFTNVDKCQEDFNYGYKNNIFIVNSLVSAFLHLRKKPHFFHFSTDQVYNSSTKNTENNVRLTNNYSVIKYISELEAKKYKKTTILRTNFFGKSCLSYRRTFSGYIASELKKKKKIYLPNNIFFNPINLQTLCQIIEKLIISKRYGVFNIGCKGGVSKFEFGKIVANKLKLDNKLIKKYKSYYKINRRPLNTIVSLEKIQKILNFKFTSLEDNFTDKEII